MSKIKRTIYSSNILGSGYIIVSPTPPPALIPILSTNMKQLKGSVHKGTFPIKK